MSPAAVWPIGENPNCYLLPLIQHCIFSSSPCVSFVPSLRPLSHSAMSPSITHNNQNPWTDDTLAAHAWDDLTIVNHMKDAARLAGAALAHQFSQRDTLEILHKGPSDFVSAADLQAEQILLRHLRHSLPGVAFLGEETGASGQIDAPIRIVMDPLDGTNNFLHGIAHFSVALALMRGNLVTAGVVFNPLNEELYWAVRGHGAYLSARMGERRLTGSRRQSLPEAVIGTCFPYHGKGDVEKCAAEMRRLMPHVSGVRSPGSAALEIAYVAEGRFDAFWSSGAKLDLWDIAAGIVIAEEAGCLASEIDGAGDALACRSLLVTAPQLQAALIQALATNTQERAA